jgi:hypothetical protein
MSGKTEEERRAPITLAVVWKDKTPKPKRKLNLSPEERAARSERMKARIKCPEFRAKQKAASRSALDKLFSDPEKKKQWGARARVSPETWLARVRVAMAERFSDPAEREKMSQQMKRLWAEGKISGKRSTWSPEGRARSIAATKISQNKRRGFAIPRHLRAQYDHLLMVKKFKAREAGRILGLI